MHLIDQIDNKCMFNVTAFSFQINPLKENTVSTKILSRTDVYNKC